MFLFSIRATYKALNIQALFTDKHLYYIWIEKKLKSLTFKIFINSTKITSYLEKLI